MNFNSFLLIACTFFCSCERPIDFEALDKEKGRELLDEEMDSIRNEDNASVQFDKGYTMLHGEPKEQNYSAGIRWLTLAAKNGHSRAQYFLGEAYLNGLGVSKNESEARKWLRLSAEQDDFLAQNVLAWLLVNSKDLKLDPVEAAKWFLRSAKNGYVEAQANLSAMYRDGKGVEKNYLLAQAWWNVAMSGDEEKAISVNPKAMGEFKPNAEEQKQITLLTLMLKRKISNL